MNSKAQNLSSTRISVGFATIVLLGILTSCASYEPTVSSSRTIEFSGFTWVVKEGRVPLGPGPNWFGGSTDQVWVDNQGFLHLKLRNWNGQWYCAEVYTQDKFGPGKYTFRLASRLDDLDPNIVVGLFTWNSRMKSFNQEIDIEISRWGNYGNQNAQFVVQPYTTSNHMQRFNLEMNGDYSTHEFTIGKQYVFFESYHGHYNKSLPGAGISNWLYHTRTGPKVRNAQIRINLWLFRGIPPSNLKEAELIIKQVEFTPLSQLQS